MAKKRRKIRIQLYSKGTDKPDTFNVPLVAIGGWLLGLAIIILAFMFWLPNNIISEKNFKILDIAKEQRAIQLITNKMEKQISEANSKIESGSDLRIKANQLAGLSDGKKKSEEIDGEEKTSFVNLDRVRTSLETYSRLRDKLLENEELANSLPLLYPITGNKNITNRFGMVQDPLTKMELPHFGLDFAVKEGDTVVATGSGIVDKIVKRKHGFGLTLEIQHSPQIKTTYAHLQNVLVQAGKPVKRGQPIAVAGRSGSVLWPVLHYEIRYDNKPINPEYYFIIPSQ
ncbi:MAG: M23 family metallopeptidase [Fibromonadaceae bacterium]|jgi:murein DD-endopeptidase MepM/ murein hydrolase activator NlpD|nr:M23 family metallopeptidase [Fibromonadaceae bacterium]